MANIPIEVTMAVDLKRDDLNNLQKMEILLAVLNQVSIDININKTDFLGTKDFIYKPVNQVVKDKTLKIVLDDFSDKEIGRSMNKNDKIEFSLNLLEQDWYVYDDNYGTSEEKHFIKFLHGYIEQLKKKYKDIYLVRNEKLFQIFRFSDGKPFEPDFVLFLKENEKSKIITYQLFIEPKGEHLISTDEWKQEFLIEIESNHKVENLQNPI